MSRPSMTRSLWSRYWRCFSHQQVAHLPMPAMADTFWFTSGSLRCSAGFTPLMRVVESAPFRPASKRIVLSRATTFSRVGRVDALLEDKPCDGPIHRPGVDVVKAEAPCERSGDRALAAGSRSVDCNDNMRTVHRSVLSSGV